MSKTLLYQGSVKNLWQVEEATLEFEFTNAYSVFDWGRMPDELVGKGDSLATLGSYFFEKLNDPSHWKNLNNSHWVLKSPVSKKLQDTLSELERSGVCHHFLKQNGTNRFLVKQVAIIKPQHHVLGNETIYNYALSKDQKDKNRLIPLEVVFRFGMPPGSSLKERLSPSYAANLGFSTLPIEQQPTGVDCSFAIEQQPTGVDCSFANEGQRFDFPILEFFTKLEPTDRFLSTEQALNYSCLSIEQFETLYFQTLCIAIWLEKQFAEIGLELWDGKLEWALLDGKLALVDSIGPDELRLLDPKSGVQISKEFLRLYYRQTPWFEATKRAKQKASLDPSCDWKNLVQNEVGSPPRLQENFKQTADLLYPSLAQAITGQKLPYPTMSLPEILERIRQCKSS